MANPDPGSTSLQIWKTQLLYSADRQGDPNAYLIEQSAHSTARTHFHDNQQFQVFVQGTGSLGRRPLQPVTVQYVAGGTAYGPIVSDREGLTYLTIRPVTEIGAHYLPESKALLPKTTKRTQRLSEPISASLPVDEGSTTAVLDEDPHGSAATLHRIEIEGSTNLGGGRFYVVLGGEMTLQHRRLIPYSCVWVPQSDRLTGMSGPHGAVLLALKFGM